MKHTILAVILALCVCGTEGGNGVVQSKGEYGRGKIVLDATPKIAATQQAVGLTAILSDRSYSGMVAFVVIEGPSGFSLPSVPSEGGVARLFFTIESAGIVRVQARYGNYNSNIETVYFYAAPPLVCSCLTTFTILPPPPNPWLPQVRYFRTPSNCYALPLQSAEHLICQEYLCTTYEVLTWSPARRQWIRIAYNTDCPTL